MDIQTSFPELPIVEAPSSSASRQRLPEWLRREVPKGNANHFTQGLMEELGLETVCDNAKCPNRMECYSQLTATFMILGNVCTRPCGFCAVGISAGHGGGHRPDFLGRKATALPVGGQNLEKGLNRGVGRAPAWPLVKLGSGAAPAPKFQCWDCPRGRFRFSKLLSSRGQSCVVVTQR